MGRKTFGLSKFNTGSLPLHDILPVIITMTIFIVLSSTFATVVNSLSVLHGMVWYTRV